MKIQIDDEVRDATPDEVARIESVAAEKIAQDKDIADKVTAKQSALAKLAALGLTPEEISAIS